MTDAMILGLTIATSSSFSVLGAMLIFAGLRGRRNPPIFTPEIADQDAVFVFRDRKLVDCSDRGRKLVTDLAASGQSDLDVLSGFLKPRFGDLEPHLVDVVVKGRLDLTAQDRSGLTLVLQYRAGLTHLRLIDPTREGALLALDRLSFQAMQDELQSLRHIARAAPVLAWQEDADGQIIWANDAYVESLMQRDQGRTAMTWPLPPLFDDMPEAGRLMLDLADGPRWFAYRQDLSDGLRAHFATPIDQAVQSELARRDMLQMLTRTFASLPIGLALFDAERRLQVFNPALVDLTGLDPFFLVARPDMAQFLHNLRELRMLPEPKDFSTWRDEFLRMEAAAATGSYNEEWVLENGQIYQVTGCPQPNGAVAFFIQDVTSDATLVRGYQAENEQTRMVLDALPDAVVAFDRIGQVIVANDAYIHLWGNDPCADLADGGIDQAQAQWIAACDPGPALHKLAAYLAGPTQADVFTATVMLRDGPPLAVQARRLADGGVVVLFRPTLADMRQAQRASLSERIDAHLRTPDIPGADAGFASIPILALTDDGDNPQLRPRGRGVRHAGTRLRN